MGNYLCSICGTYHDTTGCPTQRVSTTDGAALLGEPKHITNHCPVCEARAQQQAERGCLVCASRSQRPDKTELYRGVVKVAKIACFNAELQSDAAMGYTTDIYAIPLDDIDNLRAKLDALEKEGG